MVCAQAELLQQSNGGAGMAVLVVDADAAHRCGQLFRQQAANSLAQTADDGVLFAGDDLAALLGSLQHQLLGLVQLFGKHRLNAKSFLGLHIARMTWNEIYVEADFDCYFDFNKFIKVEDEREY